MTKDKKRTTAATVAVLLLIGIGAVSACKDATPLRAGTQGEGSPSPTATATNTATATHLPPTHTHTATPAPTVTPTHTPTPTPTSSAMPTPSLTPGCTETRGHIETGAFFSAVIGQEQPYRVYLPPCSGWQAERYPVLYMLHGYPYDDRHWDDLGIDEAADAGIAAGSLPPFIIAMPAADNEGTYTNTSGGPGSFEAVLVDEFIPFIENTYPAIGSAEARAIGGMSRGGVWSLEIAFRNPNHFAAVGGHSVALNVNRAPPVYDPLYLAADPAIRALRIFLDVGSGDWAAPGMEDLHAALEASNVPHTYHVYEGIHHDDYWAAHVAEYLAFYTAAW